MNNIPPLATNVRGYDTGYQAKLERRRKTYNSDNKKFSQGRHSNLHLHDPISLLNELVCMEYNYRHQNKNKDRNNTSFPNKIFHNMVDAVY